MAKLTIYFFGGLTVVVDGQPVKRFYSDKVRALLSYLVLESERAHPRNKLAGLLWPNFTEKRAKHNLRQALSHLRDSLGDREADPPFLLISRQSIQWNVDSDYATDMPRLADGVAASTLQPYRGELLSGLFLDDCLEFEEWLTVQREAWRQRLLQQHETVVAQLESAENHAAVQEAAQQWLTIDPWQEAAYRALMRSQAAMGDHAAALATYENCCRVLADEFGIEPTQETQTIYHKVRLDNLPVESNVPQPATPFIGRKVELQTLCRRLEQPRCRLLTLVGAGGIGKTRLAIAATAHLPQWQALFVPLADLAPAGESPQVELQILHAIASALTTLTISSRKPLLQQLVEHLHNRPVLVILDNFEHVLDGRGAVAALLQRLPASKFLVTSRSPLKLAAEWLLPVDGLRLPPADAVADNDADALSLFVESARRKQPDFDLTPANRVGAVALCRLLNGLPLAIELAATWLPMLTPDEIVSEVAQGLELLKSRHEDVPARHRSLQATCDYSWRLLSLAEQRLFAQLGIWRGGFTAAAARHIADISPLSLARLIEASMVQRDEKGRFWLHEVLRQFALEKAEGLATLQRRHAAYYASLVEQLGEELKSADFIAALEQLRLEYDNIIAALRFALEQGDAGAAQQLVTHMKAYWQTVCRFSEGREWIEQALALDTAATAVRAHALLAAATLAQLQSDWDGADRYISDARRIFESRGDQLGVGHAALLTAIVCYDRNDLDQCRTMGEQTLAIGRELSDDELRIGAHNVLGRIAHARAEHDEGQAHFEDALGLLRHSGDVRTRAVVLNNLAAIYVQRYEYANAEAMLTECIAMREQMGDRRGMALALWNLGNLLHDQRNLPACRNAYQRALTLLQAVQDRRLVLTLLAILATVPQAEQDYRPATMLMAASANLSRRFDVLRPDHFQSHFDTTVSELLAAMDEHDFRAAWMRGERMTYNEAVAFALTV